VTHPEINIHVLLAYAALAVGIAVGIAGASWRRPRREPIVQEPANKETDVGDENLYAAKVLPEQEKNHPELVKRIRETAQRLAADGREISTDDLHPLIQLPDGVDPRIMGVAFVPRKLWVKTNYKPTTRKEANSRPIAYWRLRSTMTDAA
jgi:hypothetical protein